MRKSRKGPLAVQAHDGAGRVAADGIHDGRMRLPAAPRDISLAPDRMNGHHRQQQKGELSHVIHCTKNRLVPSIRHG